MTSSNSPDTNTQRLSIFSALPVEIRLKIFDYATTLVETRVWPDNDDIHDLVEAERNDVAIQTAESLMGVSEQIRVEAEDSLKRQKMLYDYLKLAALVEGLRTN